MSKDSWFREFERLEAEHPEKTEDELSDMAHDQMADKMAQRVDRAKDERKENLHGAP